MLELTKYIGLRRGNFLVEVNIHFFGWLPKLWEFFLISNIMHIKKRRETQF